MKLYYQPEGFCFGDCMPFGKGKEFYLFHQRDARNPEPLPNCEPFGWELVTTKDFVHYDYKGLAIPPGDYDAQDQFIFAGSVFEDKDNLFHDFYTGFNRDYIKEDRPSQVLMHATSKDLLHWEKSEEKVTFTPQEGYDKDDWRDPFVLWDEEKERYILILGGRHITGKRLLNGCTVWFTSKDLKHWRFEGDFYRPNAFTMHEMPDLFRMGDWWYHIITEYSDRNKMVYRMSKSLEGPWLTPEDDAFDGRAYYAGRTFSLNGKRILFGWVPTKENDDDRKNFQWGGTFVPYEVLQREDGTLGVRMPQTMEDAFNPAENCSAMVLESSDAEECFVLADESSDIFLFDADISFMEGTRSFTLRCKADPETFESYQFNFLIHENRVVFEKTPNTPWFQCMNIGLERPLVLEAEKHYHIRLVVDDTIGTLFVDDIALNVRMYNEYGTAIAMSVTGGLLNLEGAKIANGLKK